MRLIDADTICKGMVDRWQTALIKAKADERPTVQPWPGWISVKDRLPDEEDDVLVLVREVEHYGRYGEKRKVYLWVFTGWCVDGEWATTFCHGNQKIEAENEKYPNCEHTVTHWMPLPEPPKGD